MSEYFRIGQVARMTGLSIKAIRYYETVGVLPLPMRSEGRYRLYDQQDIRRLNLLKLAKQLGATVREASEMLDLTHLGCCVTVRPSLRILLDEKLRQIDALVRDLQTLRARLVEYAEQLPAGMVDDAATCTPESCVPAVQMPIALLIGGRTWNGRLSSARVEPNQRISVPAYSPHPAPAAVEESSAKVVAVAVNGRLV